MLLRCNVKEGKLYQQSQVFPGRPALIESVEIYSSHNVSRNIVEIIARSSSETRMRLNKYLELSITLLLLLLLGYFKILRGKMECLIERGVVAGIPDLEK